MKRDINNKSYSTIINLLQKETKTGHLCNILDIKVFLIYI